MFGLDDHADAARSQLLVAPIGDLGGQTLLDLKVTGEEVNHTAELRQSDDPLARQIADVGDAVKREHVVHAEGLEWDVADDHMLVVALVFGNVVALKGTGVSSSA